MQGFGQRNSAVGALAVFDQGDQQTRQGDAGAV